MYRRTHTPVVCTASLHVCRRLCRMPLKSSISEISFKPFVWWDSWQDGGVPIAIATGRCGFESEQGDKMYLWYFLDNLIIYNCLSCFPTCHIGCRSERSHCKGHPNSGSYLHPPPDGRFNTSDGGIFQSSLRLAVEI